MNRVVITGIGALTPLGNTFDESWQALREGLSGISVITRFDIRDLPWQLAGELKDFDPGMFISKKEINKLDPFVQYAVAAASMAVEDSALPTEHFKDTGIVIGSSRGGITTVERQIKRRRVSAYLMPVTTISMAASYVAQRLGIRGYCIGLSNACASGATAIGEAYRLIRTGVLKSAIAGGADAPICKVCLMGYGASGVLSTRTSETPSPFDKKRDGFVLSEGSCIVVMEDLKEAIKRGAKIYGEVIGYGNIVDAFHITRPSPTGEASAIESALKMAGIDTNEVDLISTHGTGTIVGDHAEMRALERVFGKRDLPAMAIKSMSGHMLGASGAFEVAVTIKSLQEKVIPPTINVSELEDDCRLRLFKVVENSEVDTAITNSFGFGGVNTVIVLRAIRE